MGVGGYEVGFVVGGSFGLFELMGSVGEGFVVEDEAGWSGLSGVVRGRGKGKCGNGERGLGRVNFPGVEGPGSVWGFAGEVEEGDF